MDSVLVVRRILTSSVRKEESLLLSWIDFALEDGLIYDVLTCGLVGEEHTAEQ